MSQNLDQPDKLELLRIRRDKLVALVNDEAYQMVMGALESQLRGRRIEAFNNPIRSLDGAFESANRSGELAGIQLGLSMRDVLVSDLSADIQAMLEEERNQEDASNRDRGNDRTDNDEWL